MGDSTHQEEQYNKINGHNLIRVSDKWNLETRPTNTWPHLLFLWQSVISALPEEQHFSITSSSSIRRVQISREKKRHRLFQLIGWSRSNQAEAKFTLSKHYILNVSDYNSDKNVRNNYVKVMTDYIYEELADMHLIYGQECRNALEAKLLHREIVSMCRMAQYSIYARVEKNAHRQTPV